MAEKPSAPFLRLIEPSAKQAPLDVEPFSAPSWQRTLFAQSNPSLLVFADFDALDETDFVTLIVSARLKYMVDLRLVPRFDLGNLNRKMVFSLLGQSGTSYIDLSGQLGLRDHRDAQLNPAILSDILRKAVSSTSAEIDGPIAILVDTHKFDDSYIEKLVEALSTGKTRGWELLKVPAPGLDPRNRQAAKRRSAVFISHANPEDNVFALWLAGRLTCAGYQVWSDVTKLVGGEEFWDSIEDAIRKQSAKVIVVLSRKAQTKKGVLDEINCAVSVERAEGLEGFVVPIRLDDLPYSDIRANLARKNVVDFHRNWARGLERLLTLLERDGVPRANRDGAAEAAAWSQKRLRLSEQLRSTPETLVSNWLAIEQMPSRLSFFDTNVTSDRIDALVRAAEYPCFQFYRLVGSFADRAALQQGRNAGAVGRERYSISLDEFLAGTQSALPVIAAREAHNIVSSLFRQAWARQAQAKGLRPYVTASGGTAWYFPKDVVEGNQIKFDDLAGKRRRKTVVGWSERRHVFWHLAIDLRPVLGRIPRMVGRTHIVFTTDGATLIDSKEKMHAMRRQFCRSWWNDRWRDLLLAFCEWMSEGNARIALPMGNGVDLILGGKPMIFVSPVSVVDDEDDTDKSDEAIDELDIAGPDLELDFEQGSDFEESTAPVEQP